MEPPEYQGIGGLEGASWIWPWRRAHWLLSDWAVSGSDPGCVPVAGTTPTFSSSLSGMSTPGSSPQHRPLSLSTEARRQQAQQVSPTLSPLSPITQVRGLSGAGEVGPGSASVGSLSLLPGNNPEEFPNIFYFGIKCSNTWEIQKMAWRSYCRGSEETMRLQV